MHEHIFVFRKPKKDEKPLKLSRNTHFANDLYGKICSN